MPSAETFSIKPIAELLDRWLEGRKVIVDPFARNSKRGTITNDLNPETTADYHEDATEFLCRIADDGMKADAVLVDPPYSPRQVKECYSGFGMKMQQHEALLGFTRKQLKKPIERLLGPCGVTIWCGWNSVGMGEKTGFERREILLVCHGSDHNDTIVTVEEKLPNLFDQGSASRTKG